MFIRNCITDIRELVTLNKNDSINFALKTMQKNKLKSVPVIDDDGRFAGILSKEALFEVFEKYSNKTLNELKKEEIENTLLSIKPLNLDNKFEETLPIIVRYPFVPIVDDDFKLIGIVKRKQVTNALESSFGVERSGIRILIGTPEMEGRLEKIFEIAHNLHLNIITAVAFDSEDRFNRRILLKIEHSDNKKELLDKLEKNGFIILSVHEI